MVLGLWGRRQRWSQDPHVIFVGVGGIWAAATATVVEARLWNGAMFIEQAFDADASSEITVTIGGTVTLALQLKGSLLSSFGLTSSTLADSPSGSQ